MAIPLYLAMTAAEFRNNTVLPAHMAWMACHFSPYGTGLTNLPKQLPKGALLILNDRTPIHRHDAGLIAATLEELVTALDCCGLLMDFQRPDCPETEQIVRKLTELPFRTAVSELYGRELDCPVFLSALPVRTPPESCFASWAGREIWLEAALGGQIATVTEKGCHFSPLPPGDPPQWQHCDEALFCRYQTESTPGKVCFTLQRNREDLSRLLEYAETLGVTQAVGLYQELGK